MPAHPPGSSGGDPTLAGDVIGLGSANTIDALKVTTGKLADSAVTGAKIAAAVKDPAAGTAGLRTLGTGATQAAPGNHAHTLNDATDVDTAGAVSGTSVLGFVSGNWVPVPGGGGAVFLDDLSDVDVSASTNGQVLGKVSGTWRGITIPGGATNLDDLADVVVTAPVSGQVLGYLGGSWVNVPGSSGGLTFMDTPEGHGAQGDLVMALAAVSATASQTRLTWVPGSTTSSMIGKLVHWAAGATTETAEVGSLVVGSTTQLNLVQPGTNTPYVIANNVTNAKGAMFTDDTVAMNATVVAAKASGRQQIGLRPGGRYGITNDIDCSNYQGLRWEGLGGGSYSVSNTNATQAGGSFVFPCKATAMTCFRGGNNGGDPANDQITHNGMHVSRIGFHDPTGRKVHTGILTQFQTRTRVEKCHGTNLARFCHNQSGSKDASWGTWRDNSSSDCTVHYYLHNALTNGAAAPTGAMAITLDNNNMQIGANCTGVDWFGGQFGHLINGKWDIDGAGSCGARFRGGVAYPLHGTGLGADNTTNYAAGTSPSSSKTVVSGITVEATGTAMDNTSYVFDIMGGSGQLTFTGNIIGGGGGTGGIGYAIGVNGTGTVDDVTIQGGGTINRTWCIVFGPWAKNAKVIGHQLGGNGGYIRYDTNGVQSATRCGFSRCHFDVGGDPTKDITRIDATNGVENWWDWVFWNNGFTETATFTSIAAIPANYGRVGSVAYITTAGSTEGMATKLSTGWALSAGGGGGGSQTRIIGVSRGGTLPVTVTDGADFHAPAVGTITLSSMKVVCKTAPAGAMKVQLRRSVDQGVTFTNMAGFLVTFVGGVKTATVTPGSAIPVNDGDLFDLSITALGSGTNLAVYAIGT